MTAVRTSASRAAGALHSSTARSRPSPRRSTSVPGRCDASGGGAPNSVMRTARRLAQAVSSQIRLVAEQVDLDADHTPAPGPEVTHRGPDRVDAVAEAGP